MQSISEILQTLARQHGRGDTQPLLLLRSLDGAPGERISHLPIDADLAKAWVALTGEPFRPHQAHALTALRRGEPVALRASSADVAMSAHLLLYAVLMPDPAATALLLVPDDAAAQRARAQLAEINRGLPRSLDLTATQPEPHRRPDHYARIVIATPESVHSRLLRHHDRAWRLFWPGLRLAVLPDMERYSGVAAAHLADLLLRIQRVGAAHAGGLAPNVLGTLAEVAEPEPTLTGLLGHPWRVVPADDGPRAPTSFAVWRGGAARLRDAIEIATAMQRQGQQAHIACRPLECAALAPMLGDLPGITFGAEIAAGSVLVVTGYPGSHATLRRMLRSGYQAVVLVLGELPHEQALARHVETMLADPATSWLPPPINAYVTAQHILCAASEQPLTEEEVVAWGVEDIVERLVAQGQLVDLPDPEVAWKPTDAAGDPYVDFSLRSSSGGAIALNNQQSQRIGTIAPVIFERWAFPNAALPPGIGGFRALGHDEDSNIVSLRLESSGRRTYPLRRCEVTVRETRETRALAGGRSLAWGRVVVNEEIYGYREATAAGAPTDLALKPPLTTRWTAPACWFDLAANVQVHGQSIGWSLAAALPLRTLAEFTDVVPCYDHEARRLYIVDAQPGGSGLAAWLYARAEELLPLAYDIALACNGDLLLEPFSRVDMDWLLALLGRHLEEPAPERPRPAPRPEPPQRTQFIEGPPPAHPSNLSLPTTDDRKPSAAPVDDRPRPARAQPAPIERRRETPPARQPEPPLPARPQSASPERRRSPADDSPPDRVNGPRPRSEPSSQPPAPPARPTQKTLPTVEPAQERPPKRQPAPAPQRGQPTPPPPPDEAPPDPAALIERLRRQRQQREAGQAAGPNNSRRAERPSGAGDAAVEQRFAAGDRIFCLPYGDGEVRASRVEDGRELLTVHFPSYGELTIDPVVSLVRKLEDTPAEPDDLL